MTEAVGVRLPDDVLAKIDALSEEEAEDRSTLIRKLLRRGYEEFMKEKAAQAYKEGTVTIAGAAERAGITIWEMQEYLVDQGYVSSYSIEDLEAETI